VPNKSLRDTIFFTTLDFSRFTVLLLIFNKNMNKLFLLLFTISSLSCQSQTIKLETPAEKKIRQDAIIQEHVYNCADKINHTVFMQEYQNCLDVAIEKDSTIAYLWQQKAMPYFKARKYEIGMEFIDKAVKYDAARWQPYRAFIKCIFAKTYEEAIVDFEDCKKKYGNNHVMDHTFDFYIALCNLQLNNIPDAEKLLANYVADMKAKNGESWVHPTALFYYGISLNEQRKWQEADATFDRALNLYANFSDAKFYKAICQARLGNTEEYQRLLKESDYKIGYGLNEDNVIYETYPYQKKW
jgi:tetratricopeptide (TPR) repeat protein